MSNHESTVKEMYAAFGRGDVQAILERVSNAVDWDYNVGASEIPWHAPIRGKAQLPGFFAAFAQNVALECFEPVRFLSAGDQVAVRIQIAYTIKQTGKRVAMQQIHWWTFDAGGKVAALRHFEDTAQVQAANR